MLLQILQPFVRRPTSKCVREALNNLALQAGIARGHDAADGMVPSDRELMRDIKVSRQTVIRALHDLHAERIVLSNRVAANQ